MLVKAALLLCFLTVAQATIYFQEKFDGANGGHAPRETR